MHSLPNPDWYIVGYLRTVPDEHAFVFPVVQNADVAVGRAYYALNGTKLEFVQPDAEDTLIRISPVGIPGVSQLQDALPIYGYEFRPGVAWFGDARQLSKILIDFSCGNENLGNNVRREISEFVGRVISGDEFIAKCAVLLQGYATISEGTSRPNNIEMIEGFDLGTQIKVIGVGDGGGNAVEHMISHGVQGAQFICVNTDSHALLRSSAKLRLQLGDSGLGAGTNPEAGKAAAEEAAEQIRAALDGTQMLFIAAGMGGGTGTGAAPVIARIAKEMGILTVAVVTKPFEFEGGRRMIQAELGLNELEANVDSLIVVRGENLLQELGDDVTQEEAFCKANDVLRHAVSGISHIMHIPGLINVDFEDVATVMREPGKAMLGTAVANGHDRATMAAEAAVASPLFDGIDLSSARAVLVLISAGKSSFKLSESRNAMNIVRRYAAEDAHMIYGTAYDEKLGNQLRVTVIATGLSGAERAQVPMTMVHGASQAHAFARTGTDNHSGQFSFELDFQSSPSVWRGNRPKVDIGVDTMASNGMEEIEIPAFLRKQAD